MVFIKNVSGNADAGTGTQWGGNDITYIDDYFNDVDITPKVAKINTRTYFRSGKFEWRDSDNTHSYIISTGNLAANRTINIPVLTADATLAFTTDIASLYNTFTVYIEGGTYKAKNGATGIVDFTNADAGALLASIFNSVSVTTPLYINIGPGDFTIKSWGESNFRHSNVTIKGAGSGLTQFIVHNDVFDVAGQDRVFAFEASGSAFTSNTIAANAAAGSFAVETNSVTDLAAGDHVIIGSTLALQGTAEAGEHNRIVKIFATGGSPSQRIILEKATRYAYNTADTPFIRKVGFLENNRFEGFTIKSNQDFDTNITFMRLDFNYDCHMNDVQFKDWGIWMGGGFHHCFVNNVIVNSYFNDLVFEESPERGHATGGAGGNENPTGYAISTRAGCETVFYTNCRFKGAIRHCFTTTANSETAKKGMPINIWLINCNAETTTEASFDTHEEGNEINFINCSVHSTRSAGATDTTQGSEDTDAFNIRSNNTRCINCSVVGIRGKAFSCDTATSGNIFDGCYVDNMMKSSFGMSPSGTNTIVRNCVIKNVDGDGISVGDGSTGMQISNCFIKNAARIDDTKIPLYIGNCTNVQVSNVTIDRSNDADIVPVKTHASSDNITFSNMLLIGTGANPLLQGTNTKWNILDSIGWTAPTQTFYASTLKQRNPADTFSYTIVPSAIVADRNITLPLLTGNDTAVTEAFIQTLTNKTISGASNTISNIADSALSANVVREDIANTYGDFAQLFKDDKVQINNPADTFKYTVIASAIAADRNMTLPLASSNWTLPFYVQSGTTTDTHTTSAEFDILNYSVAANQMGANGCVRFTITGYLLQNQATGTTYTFRVKFGTSTMYQDVTASLAQSALKLAFRMEGEIFNKNATNAQGFAGKVYLNDITNPPTIGIGDSTDDEQSLQANIDSEDADQAKDTTSSQTLQVTMQMSVSNAATHTVIKHTLVEVLPAT